MKRALAVLILLAVSLPLFSQQSTPANPEWPICFTESQWNALLLAVQMEQEKTAQEAVDAAVVPLEKSLQTMEFQRNVLLGTATVTTTAFLVTLVILLLSAK